MDTLAGLARAEFSRRLGGRAEFAAAAPGRVELLGNHTDYNGGIVLAAAIDRWTVVVGRPRLDRQARLWAVNLGEEDRFAIDSVQPRDHAAGGSDWVNYPRGVVDGLQGSHGPLVTGFEAVVIGDVPLGAGLSSSASLQTAFAVFLHQAGLVPGTEAGMPLNDDARWELARLIQRCENQFVGVNCGLLDMFTSLFGEHGHALMLDCASHERARVPLGPPVPAIVVCDSRTERRLADGMYNQRREECERVVRWFQAERPDRLRNWLRDVTLAELDAHWEKLDPIGRLRARHVLSENSRVLEGVAALSRGDLAALGRLMSQSHGSSRDDFANSSPALESLVDAARAAPGFLGGKLSGAGWAGCTVNLVEADRAESFAEHVRAAYERAHGAFPTIHLCVPSAGAWGWRES